MFTSKVHFMLLAGKSSDGKKHWYRYLYVDRFPCPDDMDFAGVDFIVGSHRIEIGDSEKVYCLDTDSWRVAADCRVHDHKGKLVAGTDLVRTGDWEEVDTKTLSGLLSQSFFRDSNFT